MLANGENSESANEDFPPYNDYLVAAKSTRLMPGVFKAPHSLRMMQPMFAVVADPAPDHRSSLPPRLASIQPDAFFLHPAKKRSTSPFCSRVQQPMITARVPRRSFPHHHPCLRSVDQRLSGHWRLTAGSGHPAESSRAVCATSCPSAEGFAESACGSHSTCASGGDSHECKTAAQLHAGSQVGINHMASRFRQVAGRSTGKGQPAAQLRQ
jgi:hypothetical protein